MRKVLSLLSFLFITSVCSAQITLEHSYTVKTGQNIVVLFSSNGTKYMMNDTGASQVKLYNTDHSLWKTINVPTYAGYKFFYAYVVSDNLFNSDNLVELVAVYSATSGSTYKCEVINESGSVIQTLGDANYAAVHYVNGSYKLITNSTYFSGSLHYTHQVYSLPGTIPCGQCGSLGVEKTQNTTDNGMVVPNPNNGEFTTGESGELIITNATGETIYTDRKYNGGSINIKSQPAGIYFLKVGDKVVPFVKQ